MQSGFGYPEPLFYLKALLIINNFRKRVFSKTVNGVIKALTETVSKRIVSEKSDQV